MDYKRRHGSAMLLLTRRVTSTQSVWILKHKTVRESDVVLQWKAIKKRNDRLASGHWASTKQGGVNGGTRRVGERRCHLR